MTANAACNMANRLCANFVPEPGQNKQLPLRNTHGVSIAIVGVFLLTFRSGLR